MVCVRFLARVEQVKIDLAANAPLIILSKIQTCGIARAMIASVSIFASSAP